MKSEVQIVGTFAVDGHPVGWKFDDELTVGVREDGMALYCGWTCEELRQYRKAWLAAQDRVEE